MNLTETLLKKKNIFKGKIIDVHVDEVLLPNGKPAKREVVDHPGGVCIVALTDNYELLFVRQFRYPYAKELLELPAGKLVPELSPLENAKKELLEETGAIAKDFYFLGKMYPSPGYASEIIYSFFCKVSSFTEARPDEDEFVNLEKINLNDALELVLQDKIHDCKTQISILKVSALLKSGTLKI